MSLHRGIDGAEPHPEPIGRLGGTEEVRPSRRTSLLAVGTLACPDCDAPVAPTGPLTPTHAIACPFCARDGVVRDFLSLAPPSRPARVAVRVVQRHRARR